MPLSTLSANDRFCGSHREPLGTPGPVAIMPVFEAKNLDSDYEGFAFLAAILHPSAEAQTRALTHGRNRAARGAMIADPMTIEPRFPVRSAETEIEAQSS